MFSFFKKKNSQTHKLCYEVDLHSHILPGIDDGSPNTEKSIGLIREMQNWGIRKIIATPHIAEETFENTPETIKNAWDLLKTALKSEGIEQEIRTTANVSEKFVILPNIASTTVSYECLNRIS